MTANNNIRSIILEIKNDRCKIVKIQIFRSLSREHIHFHLLWKCSRKRERNISILTILHVSFLISNMTLLILLFAINDEITFGGCFLEYSKCSVALITFEMLRFFTCLQQSVLEFGKHSKHFPLVNLLVASSFLFFSTVFPPINCLRFFFAES